MKKSSLALLTLLLVWASSSCTDRQIREQLDLADQQVTINADSTLTLLNAIDPDDLSHTEDIARWGLLHTWALYRSYAKDIPEEPLLQAFQYYHNGPDPLRRAQVYYLLSVVQEDQHRGEPSQWLEDLYRACLSIQQTDDHVLAAQIYQRYENKLYKMHQYDRAIEWGHRFVQEAHLSDNRNEELLAMTNLSLAQFYAEVHRVSDSLHTDDAQILAQATQFSAAFSTIYQALDLARQLGYRSREGKICGNISSYYSMAQRPDSALHYALLAKDIDEELVTSGKSNEPINYYHVAEAYRKVQQPDSAIRYALLTLSSKSMTTRRNAANTLYLTYRDQKQDYRQAMEWMKLNNAIQDSIQKRINAEQVGAAQDAVQTEIEKGELQKQKQSAMDWLFWCLLISTAIVAIVVIHMVQNRFRFQARLKEQEEEFNRLLAERRATPPAPQTVITKQPEVVKPTITADRPEVDDTTLAATPAATEATTTAPTSDSQPTTTPSAAPVPSLLVLTGSTKEQLTIVPDALLFLTSESNYIKVYYLSAEGKVQSKMLRQTMSRLEEQLSSFDFIVRCHRAFFVNLQHVVHASSVPTGLQLSLDASTASIPVSRTYIADIRNWLAKA